LSNRINATPLDKPFNQIDKERKKKQQQTNKQKKTTKQINEIQDKRKIILKVKIKRLKISTVVAFELSAFTTGWFISS